MGENVHHQAKISSLFPTEFFPDKVTLILSVPLNICLILLINYFKMLIDI